jgi:hypothetical protein
VFLFGKELFSMTSSERLESWQNLSFWQRIAFECSIWVGVSIAIDLIFRRSFDFEWIISGFAWAVFCAVLDHAHFSRSRRHRRE